jgi:hypothetical protein
MEELFRATRARERSSGCKDLGDFGVFYHSSTAECIHPHGEEDSRTVVANRVFCLFEGGVPRHDLTHGPQGRLQGMAGRFGRRSWGYLGTIGLFAGSMVVRWDRRSRVSGYFAFEGNL